jgi:hypothetical protein
MRRFRFHLGTIVIVVLFIGVGIAALRESNEIWDSGIFSVTFGVFLVSILLAIHRTERRRAFWLGFALFGWIYLVLTLMPSIEPRLITTTALTLLDSNMPRSSPAGFPDIDYNENGSIDLFVANNTVGRWNSLVGTSLKRSSGTGHFVRIGHSLFAVVAALLGGQLSRYLNTKNPQGTSGPVQSPSSISSESGE